MISAAQIRAGRALINAKQSELAKAAGVALATLNNIERGVGDPRSSTLDAIERALAFAGVECEGDGQRETVTLQRLSRPSAHDTYFACQRVLECLEPGSLLKVERARFYVQTNLGMQQTETPRRIAVMIEGESRSLLFDQANFSLTDSVRVAEVARMLTAAMVNCPDGVEYVTDVVEDTTISHLEEAAYRLAGMNWKPLSHPKDLLLVYGEWTPSLQRLSETREHPLHEAFSAAGGAPASSGESKAFTPPPLPDEPDEEPVATETKTEKPAPATPTGVERQSDPGPQTSTEQPAHRALSPEEVARLLGESEEVLPSPDEAGQDDGAEDAPDNADDYDDDDGPPLPDISAPAVDEVNRADVGEPPPLPDPSAPPVRGSEESGPKSFSSPEPPLPDPSGPVESIDIDDVLSGYDDEDNDPLSTTPPPSFKT